MYIKITNLSSGTLIIQHENPEAGPREITLRPDGWPNSSATVELSEWEKSKRIEHYLARNMIKVEKVEEWELPEDDLITNLDAPQANALREIVYDPSPEIPERLINLVPLDNPRGAPQMRDDNYLAKRQLPMLREAEAALSALEKPKPFQKKRLTMVRKRISELEKDPKVMAVD